MMTIGIAGSVAGNLGLSGGLCNSTRASTAMQPMEIWDVTHESTMSYPARMRVHAHSLGHHACRHASAGALFRRALPGLGLFLEAYLRLLFFS